MNAKIISGRELKMLVIVKGLLFHAAEKESPRDAFYSVVFLFTRQEKITTNTTKMLIITLKKLVNLSAVNSLGKEIGNTIKN